MRYFLLIFLTLVAVVVGIAGLRGHLSRKPPILIIPDLNHQFKLRPEQPNGFFANGLSSQLPPPGTVPRSQPMQTLSGPVYPYEDSPANTGLHHRHDQFCGDKSAAGHPGAPSAWARAVRNLLHSVPWCTR